LPRVALTSWCFSGTLSSPSHTTQISKRYFALQPYGIFPLHVTAHQPTSSFLRRWSHRCTSVEYLNTS